MLDQAGDTPTAPPPGSFLVALLGGGAMRVTTHADGPGLRAEPNGAGGFHVGRHTLVRVDDGAPITWERFAADNAHVGKGELRIILADLAACGRHASDVALEPPFQIALVPASEAATVSPARTAAEAELARLDALVCQLAEARRRYAADTACNAWTLEQVSRDVARAAEAAARAFAHRSELA